MIGEIILKLNCSSMYEHYFEFSGLSIEDLFFILGNPERLLVTYNETKELLLLRRDEFFEFFKDRMKYWDIVCIDCNKALDINDISIEDKDRFLSFIYNKNQPLNSILKTVCNSFVIYSHDRTLYSCLWTKIDEFDLFCSTMKRVLNCLNLNINLFTGDVSFKNLFDISKNGLIVDLSDTCIIDNNLRIKIDSFASNDEISDWIFSKKLPTYKYYHLKI